ncbi:hypothetical protein FISHEDRAFT_78030 [Fistulina hepatica ATCC 64428]|nr:hypothetical protein FISHEDRAFT_78030 [Fistulina hepatica ATCC 64428]
MSTYVFPVSPFPVLISFVIFGRKIANEWLAFSTLALTGGIIAFSTRSKKVPPPKPGQTAADRAKEVVPISASSRFVYAHVFALGLLIHHFFNVRIVMNVFSAYLSALQRGGAIVRLFLFIVLPRAGYRQLTRMASIQNFIAEAEKEAHH